MGQTHGWMAIHHEHPRTRRDENRSTRPGRAATGTTVTQSGTTRAVSAKLDATRGDTPRDRRKAHLCASTDTLTRGMDAAAISSPAATD
jgi:hypothetical protein